MTQAYAKGFAPQFGGRKEGHILANSRSTSAV